MLWHSSPYNTLKSGAQVEDIRTNIIPKLNEKTQNIWFGGHEHSYQKFKVDDTFYVTTGATSSFHDHLVEFENMEKLEMKFHHVRITISDKLMNIKTVCVKNRIIDDFDIKK